MKLHTKTLFSAFFMLVLLASCKDRPNAKEPEKIAKEQNKANQQHTVEQKNADYSSYLVDVVHDQLFEVELGKLGKRKSNNEKIRDFAEELEKHHESRLQKLNALASDMMYAVPHNLSDKQWDEIQDLEKTNAKNFDQKWLEVVISKHNKAADVLIDAINNVDNYNMRTQLNETLQEVRSHLEAATFIKNKQLK
ncbi:putative outer membrane protein [Myroides gitamensis]|uniref:DUF4142 domain-containing protein n=1 Tax=Myroides odoratus TaxID=256 RepID=UPI00216A5718|nr:DUF4142 domain-containing protein [Myroides odoratus]MCS4239785.1 putative membrane protein [Myroides odoratus]MDH6600683.1 putative outer membrane protein [Myroides gitamensis]